MKMNEELINGLAGKELTDAEAEKVSGGVGVFDSPEQPTYIMRNSVQCPFCHKTHEFDSWMLKGPLGAWMRISWNNFCSKLDVDDFSPSGRELILKDGTRLSIQGLYVTAPDGTVVYTA